MNAQPILYVFSFFIIFTRGGSESTGLMVTKYASAGQRAVLLMARTPVVWVFSLVFEWEKFIVY